MTNAWSDIEGQLIAEGNTCPHDWFYDDSKWKCDECMTETSEIPASVTGELEFAALQDWIRCSCWGRICDDASCPF